jgi:hypothetical protein
VPFALEHRPDHPKDQETEFSGVVERLGRVAGPPRAGFSARHPPR